MFNKRHQLTGHVLQRRFHAVVLEHQAHLLHLMRYIAQNPVRAQLVGEPELWRWSSYTSLCGLTHAYPWVNDEWLLSQFAGNTRSERIEAYRRFVTLGRGGKNPMAKRVTVPPLAALAAQHSDRNGAIAQVHRSGTYSVTQLAEYFGVSCKTVRRAIKAASSS